LQLRPKPWIGLAIWMAAACLAPRPLAAQLPTPTLTLGVSPSPASFGQPVTISVTVAPPVGSALTPTGSVELQVNGTSYGAAIPLVSGAATILIPDPANKIPDPSLILPVTSLDSGGNLIGVEYSGDGDVYSAATQTAGLRVLPTIVVSPNPAV
jgi:hypothetical protein